LALPSMLMILSNLLETNIVPPEGQSLAKRGVPGRRCRFNLDQCDFTERSRHVRTAEHPSQAKDVSARQRINATMVEIACFMSRRQGNYGPPQPGWRVHAF